MKEKKGFVIVPAPVIDDFNQMSLVEINFKY